MSNNLYKEFINTMPRKTLLEVVEPIFNNKSLITGLDWKMPIRKFYYLYEDFDSTPSYLEIKEAHNIFISLRNFIIKNISKEEKDIIALYTTYGDLAQFKYNTDIQRISEFNNVLNNGCTTVNTKYGQIIFEFTTRNKYNIPSDVLAIYDDESKKVMLFIDNDKDITTEDLIEILRSRDKFIHELSHYIDDINKNLSKQEYGNTKEETIKYLNDPNEFKAISHSIIYTFGGYLFKNQNRLTNRYDLTSKKDIEILFDIFLNDISNNNVVSAEDLENFKLCIKNWNFNNKSKFYDFLYNTISNTQNKINYSESERKNNMLKLLTLEEQLLEGKENE